MMGNVWRALSEETEASRQPRAVQGCEAATVETRTLDGRGRHTRDELDMEKVTYENSTATLSCSVLASPAAAISRVGSRGKRSL